MFNMNEFKQKTKEWLKENPDSSKQDFLAFCHDLLPADQSLKYSWLIDQVDLGLIM